MNYCEDCGCIVDGGYCVNCNEETFIAQQNYSNDEPIEFSEEFNEKLVENDKQAIKRNKKIEER